MPALRGPCPQREKTRYSSLPQPNNHVSLLSREMPRGKVGRGQVKRSWRDCSDFLSCSIRSEALMSPWWDLGSLQRWDLGDPCRLLPDRSSLWHGNRSVGTSPCFPAASWPSADTLTRLWPVVITLRVSQFQEAGQHCYLKWSIPSATVKRHWLFSLTCTQ